MFTTDSLDQYSLAQQLKETAISKADCQSHPSIDSHTSSCTDVQCREESWFRWMPRGLKAQLHLARSGVVLPTQSWFKKVPVCAQRGAALTSYTWSVLSVKIQRSLQKLKRSKIEEKLIKWCERRKRAELGEIVEFVLQWFYLILEMKEKEKKITHRALVSFLW